MADIDIQSLAKALSEAYQPKPIHFTQDVPLSFSQAMPDTSSPTGFTTGFTSNSTLNNVSENKFGTKEYIMVGILILLFIVIFVLYGYLGYEGILQNTSAASCYANAVTSEDVKVCTELDSNKNAQQ